jgi:hypothetical protein
MSSLTKRRITSHSRPNRICLVGLLCTGLTLFSTLACSDALNAASTVQPVLASVEAVDITVLAPTFEPPLPTNFVASLAEKRTRQIVSDGGIPLRRGAPELLVRIEMAVQNSQCAVAVTTELREDAALARLSTDRRIVVTTWRSRYLRLVATNAIADAIEEGVELTVREFVEKRLQAREFK